MGDEGYHWLLGQALPLTIQDLNAQILSDNEAIAQIRFDGGDEDDPCGITIKLQLEDGDFLLVCSDGYADQFGSEFGKKLGRRNFANLIIEASKMDNADEMAKFLYDKHIEWRGNLEQVDDISIVGIVVTQSDDDDDDDDDD